MSAREAPTPEDVAHVAALSRDRHRPEGPSEDWLERRDALLADFLTAAWPTERSQRQ